MRFAISIWQNRVCKRLPAKILINVGGVKTLCCESFVGIGFIV